jgi:hypothetical protein
MLTIKTEEIYNCRFKIQNSKLKIQISSILTIKKYLGKKQVSIYLCFTLNHLGFNKCKRIYSLAIAIY